MAESQCPMQNSEYMQARMRYLEAKTKYFEVNTKLKESQSLLALNMQPAIDAITKMFMLYNEQAQEQKIADAKRRAEFDESLKANPIPVIPDGDSPIYSFTPGVGMRRVPRTSCCGGSSSCAESDTSATRDDQ